MLLSDLPGTGRPHGAASTSPSVDSQTRGSCLRDAVLAEVEETNFYAIVIDAKAISEADTTPPDALIKLEGELDGRDVRLVFARLRRNARCAMTADGLDLDNGDFARGSDAGEATSGT